MAHKDLIKIEDIKARQIMDSRGNPTVEAEVYLTTGTMGRASVPSGASTGSREAIELRDNEKSMYMGKGVLQAVDNINTVIARALISKDPLNQKEIDNLLIEIDGSSNKGRLGANAILAVSLAVARASSKALNLPLFQYIGGINGVTMPVPMMNILNGGIHADNKADFQEYMICPVEAVNFQEAVKIGTEVFHNLRNVLKSKGYSTTVGDEGGFAPDLKSNEEGIELILKAIETAGYTTENVKICLDIAASEIYSEGKYWFKSENRILNSFEMVDFLENWVKNYPIISIEDGMAENDFQGWKMLTERLGGYCQLVGDDLFVTNVNLLCEGIQRGFGNSILIKPNQIGTLSETLDAVNTAHEAGYTTIISHRSGETEDTFIADLAVALNAGQIKTGSMSRTDRVSKYNELIRIEENLGSAARFLGLKAFNLNFKGAKKGQDGIGGCGCKWN